MQTSGFVVGAPALDVCVEERANERTRIARELHDSLLQGFQGLLLHLQAAQRMLPARPEDAMRALGKLAVVPAPD
jgi:signal transduction histidine kinase